MRKTITAVAGAALMVAGLAAPMAPLAAKSDNAATINKDFGCGFAVATPEGIVIAQGDSPTRVVTTSSGNVTGFCNIDVTSGSVSKAFVLKGFGCTVAGNVATDTILTVSPSGKATLRCTVRQGKL
ncbi:hypothetical protein [Parerythrobacter aestuarii]|uniref:hypothetical protein n=1 Tax=Parerythrobacter aestuarii TaxID=3020909 RepID=UPI0024DEBD58|nr:hypothetical protein [Parerythrobacter aestuarii]